MCITRVQESTEVRESTGFPGIGVIGYCELLWVLGMEPWSSTGAVSIHKC